MFLLDQLEAVKCIFKIVYKSIEILNWLDSCVVLDHFENIFAVYSIDTIYSMFYN